VATRASSGPPVRNGAHRTVDVRGEVVHHVLGSGGWSRVRL
jgi:hypothetical protein